MACLKFYGDLTKPQLKLLIGNYTPPIYVDVITYALIPMPV